MGLWGDKYKMIPTGHLIWLLLIQEASLALRGKAILYQNTTREVDINNPVRNTMIYYNIVKIGVEEASVIAICVWKTQSTHTDS